MKVTLTPAQLKRLQMITGHAAVECSHVFSKWVHGGVSVSFDKVEVVPFESAFRTPNKGESSEEVVAIGIFLSVVSGFQGSLLFLLSENAAFELFDILLKKEPGTTRTMTPLVQSALLETANILASSYLNAMTAGLKIPQSMPSPPIFMHDLKNSILDTVLTEQATVQEEALMVQVDFYHAKRQIDWDFFVLPVFDSLGKLLDRLIEEEAA